MGRRIDTAERERWLKLLAKAVAGEATPEELREMAQMRPAQIAAARRQG